MRRPIVWKAGTKPIILLGEESGCKEWKMDHSQWRTLAVMVLGNPQLGESEDDLVALVWKTSSSE